MVDSIWVSNQKQWDQLDAEGLQPWKKSWVEMESDVDSEWSGLGGKKDWRWRQEVSFALEEIWELIREQNGHLKKNCPGSRGRLGAQK